MVRDTHKPRRAAEWGAGLIGHTSCTPDLRGTLGHERWSTRLRHDDMGRTFELYREGGPIMLLILLVGAAGLAILVEGACVIVVRSRNNGRVFIERIIQLVRAGKIDDAIKACASSAAAL